jgi:hypothetical protein
MMAEYAKLGFLTKTITKKYFLKFYILNLIFRPARLVKTFKFVRKKQPRFEFTSRHLFNRVNLTSFQSFLHFQLLKT